VTAATISPATGRRHGVTRVRQTWQVPRSSYRAANAATTAEPRPGPALRRGPKPVVAGAELLAAVQADPERSPWAGEGHRKVWARLRTRDRIRVARKRVLRLMREHHLPSPHRARARPEARHDRRITTDAPNVMWATDATQVTAARDGKAWLFGVVEH
jgi:hypothetical protein